MSRGIENHKLMSISIIIAFTPHSLLCDSFFQISVDNTLKHGLGQWVESPGLPGKKAFVQWMVSNLGVDYEHGGKQHGCQYGRGSIFPEDAWQIDRTVRLSIGLGIERAMESHVCA